MFTVIVAGGGTGGHIFPGIAIARELVRRFDGCDVLFAGTERGLESKIVPAEGFKLFKIRSAGITGKRLQARLKGMMLVPVSVAQSLALIARAKPALVIGVGGYSSGPVVAAAVVRRVPTLIHEQNYVPGVTNRWLAPFVKEVAVTYPETVKLLGGRGVLTGNPIREGFAHVRPRPSGVSGKGLLVMGGSQGARVINRAMRDALPALSVMKGRLNVTHQTGDAELAAVKSSYDASALNAKVSPFITGMPGALEEADLVVSRCGSTTLAELTAAGRPAVLIPFAAATHDHQTFNARKLEQAGAAVMILERDLTGGRLASTLIDLLGDDGRLARMAEASRGLGRPDAAERIGDLCARLVGRSTASRGGAS